MKYVLSIFAFIMPLFPQMIFNFTKDVNIQNWRIVNDGVMGGVSASSFSLGSNGHGVFQGRISLENNGGFASVRYRGLKLQANTYSHIKIRLKGDGKTYRFSVKDNLENRYSYTIPFSTSGDWEEINLSLHQMYPSFRGKKLELPNFSEETIEEIVFLIGNKKAEEFQLTIASIQLYSLQD